METIFIAGDGAPWIRGGTEYIPNAVYLLDRLHLCKYILRATGRFPELKKGIWKAIKQDDIVQVDTTLQEALTRAQSKTHKKDITDCFVILKRTGMEYKPIVSIRLQPDAVLKVMLATFFQQGLVAGHKGGVVREQRKWHPYVF